jgi:hypothetical protein
MIGLAIPLMEYGHPILRGLREALRVSSWFEVPSTSMTLFLMIAVFMVLSFGCTRSHACCSAVRLFGCVVGGVCDKCCEVSGRRRYWLVRSDLD